MELAEIQDRELMELPLFDQIDRDDIRPMLTCLGAFVREYRRKEYAVLDDELMAHVYVVMSGCIFMLKEDREGHRSFLTYIQPGDCSVNPSLCVILRSQASHFLPPVPRRCSAFRLQRRSIPAATDVSSTKRWYPTCMSCSPERTWL